MVADIAANRATPLAASSARRCASLPGSRRTTLAIFRRQWPQVRNDLRATALFVQGRVAASREQYKEAEQSLLAALTLNPEDLEALFTIGVVRMAVRADDGAARAFARVTQRGGPLVAAARESLRVLHARSTNAGASFDVWQAGLTWNPPEPAMPVDRPREPGRYAGSAVCRECHARAVRELAIDGHGFVRMFRTIDRGTSSAISRVRRSSPATRGP